MLDFLKKPTNTLVNKNSFKQNLKEFFKVFFHFFLANFVGYIFVSVTDFFLKTYSNFSFLNLIDEMQNNASEERSILFFIAFAPIVEEIIFRLPLKLTKLNLFISLVVAFLFFYSLNTDLPSLFTFKFFSIFVFYFMALGFSIFFVIKNSFLKIFEEKYYTFYFYGLAVFFGFLHVLNFIEDVPNELIFFTPIFTFFQIISGVFLGYTRVKYGMVWSIAMHGIINLLACSRYFF